MTRSGSPVARIERSEIRDVPPRISLRSMRATRVSQREALAPSLTLNLQAGEGTLRASHFPPEPAALSAIDGQEPGGTGQGAGRAKETDPRAHRDDGDRAIPDCARRAGRGGGAMVCQ